jgi:hypothetical protein
MVISLELDRLFATHAAGALEKQRHLAGLVGSRRSRFDMAGGRLAFGDDLEFAVQVLGTESRDSWSWAWAGTVSGIHPRLLKACAKLMEYGGEHGIDAFTQPTVALEGGLTAHHLAMIASGLADGDAYYRCEVGPLAVYVLIHDPAYLRMRDLDPARMLVVFDQLLENFPVAPGPALEGYLAFHGIEAREEEGRLIGEAPGGGRLVIDRDPEGRPRRFDLVGPAPATGRARLGLKT